MQLSPPKGNSNGTQSPAYTSPSPPTKKDAGISAVESSFYEMDEVSATD